MNETFLKTLARSGPWALLAGVLILYYLLRLDPKLDAIASGQHSMRAELAEQRSEEAAEAKATLNILGQILMSAERTAFLQLVQCQNSATSATELRACAKAFE